MSNSSIDDTDDSSVSEPDVSKPLQKVCIKDIKGRWLHSNANIGLIMVNSAKRRAILSDGTIWKLKEKRNTVVMGTYSIAPKKSTLSELVWVNKKNRGARRYKWFFEDDGDLELDFAPPEIGSHQLISESDDDSGARSGSDSDDDDVIAVASDLEDHTGGHEDLDMEGPAMAVPRIVDLFTEWILSTNTPAHEKRLARQGYLSKEFPIKVRGGGIRSLATKLAAFGVAQDSINHRKNGTLIILKEAVRKKFIERHPEYRSHFSQEKRDVPECALTPKRRKVDAVESAPEPSDVRAVEVLKERLLNAQRRDIYDVLLDMKQLTMNTELLRKTKVGLDVNRVTKDKKLPDHVRDKAAEILTAWKNIFYAEK